MENKDTNNSSITVFCDATMKQKVKIALLKKGYTNLKDGYLDIFKMGFDLFQKGKEV